MNIIFSWLLVFFNIFQKKQEKEKIYLCVYMLLLHFIYAFSYWWSCWLPWFSSITLQRTSVYKSPWTSAWKLPQDMYSGIEMLSLKKHAYASALTAIRLFTKINSDIHQQSVMVPMSTHLCIIWLYNSWRFNESKWYFTAVWICIPLFTLEIKYLSCTWQRQCCVPPTQFLFSRLMGRMHFIASLQSGFVHMNESWSIQCGWNHD